MLVAGANPNAFEPLTILSCSGSTLPESGEQEETKTHTAPKNKIPIPSTPLLHFINTYEIYAVPVMGTRVFYLFWVKEESSLSSGHGKDNLQ